mmetsp:Transcript_35424/g.78010  ORF Transcript_35424/g.78010 Transcript_35424/m.78010 type:complete len:559 (-) Transcript_35424:59-1735(-)
MLQPGLLQAHHRPQQIQLVTAAEPDQVEVIEVEPPFTCTYTFTYTTHTFTYTTFADTGECESAETDDVAGALLQVRAAPSVQRGRGAGADRAVERVEGRDEGQQHVEWVQKMRLMRLIRVIRLIRLIRMIRMIRLRGDPAHKRGVRRGHPVRRAQLAHPPRHKQVVLVQPQVGTDQPQQCGAVRALAPSRPTNVVFFHTKAERKIEHLYCSMGPRMPPQHELPRLQPQVTGRITRRITGIARIRQVAQDGAQWVRFVHEQNGGASQLLQLLRVPGHHEGAAREGLEDAVVHHAVLALRGDGGGQYRLGGGVGLGELRARQGPPGQRAQDRHPLPGRPVQAQAIGHRGGEQGVQVGLVLQHLPAGAYVHRAPAPSHVRQGPHFLRVGGEQHEVGGEVAGELGNERIRVGEHPVHVELLHDVHPGVDRVEAEEDDLGGGVVVPSQQEERIDRGKPPLHEDEVPLVLEVSGVAGGVEDLDPVHVEAPAQGRLEPVRGEHTAHDLPAVRVELRMQRYIVPILRVRWRYNRQQDQHQYPHHGLADVEPLSKARTGHSSWLPPR